MTDRDIKYALNKRLYISIEDLKLACYFAHFLLSNNLHYYPWEKRGKVYERQAAFTISLVISYCRPFTKSKGLPSIPKRLMPFTTTEQELHSKILGLRHKIYAHSDGDKYEVKPVGDDVFHTSIFSSNSFMMTKKDLTKLHSMINIMLSSFCKEQQLLEYQLTLTPKNEKTGST